MVLITGATGFIGLYTADAFIKAGVALKGEENYTEVPEGIAHYLEHKLFESEKFEV